MNHVDPSHYGHENEASNGVNVGRSRKALISSEMGGAGGGRPEKTKRAITWICLNRGWIIGPRRLMGVECGFNSSLIGFNIVRLHGWFSPAVWPLLLCGLDNEPEWHRGREIQAFTAFVGCCAGWSAGRKEPRATRPCTWVIQRRRLGV